MNLCCNVNSLCDAFKGLKITHKDDQKLCEKSSQQDGLPLSRFLRPVGELLIDFNKLQDVVSLKQKNCSIDLFQKIAISPINLLSDHKWITWRIRPEVDHLIVEFRDPQAKELKQCDQVFCEIHVHPEGQAELREIVSASFSGPQALKVVWNFMKVAHVANLMLRDVSTIVPCCPEGSFFPLLVAEVMKRGMGWYEKQGARADFNPGLFSNLLDHDIVFPLYSETVCEPRDIADGLQNKASKRKACASLIDYRLFQQKVTCQFENRFFHPSAYNIACITLYHTKVFELKHALMAFDIGPLDMMSQKALTFCRHLSQACQILGKKDDIRVGALFRETFKLGRRRASRKLGPISSQEEVAKFLAHQTLHNLQDYLVGNKDSFLVDHLMQMWQESKKKVSYPALIFAFLAIDSVFRQSKEFSKPIEGLSQLVWKTLFPDKPVQSYTPGEFRRLTARMGQMFLELIEKDVTTPISCKLYNSAEPKQLIGWMRNYDEMKLEDAESFLKAVLQYFLGLPVVDLLKACPQFIEKWFDALTSKMHLSSKLKISISRDRLKAVGEIIDKEKVDKILFDKSGLLTFQELVQMVSANTDFEKDKEMLKELVGDLLENGFYYGCQLFTQYYRQIKYEQKQAQQIVPYPLIAQEQKQTQQKVPLPSPKVNYELFMMAKIIVKCSRLFTLSFNNLK